MGKRVFYFDALRVLAAFAVVIIHIAGTGLYSSAIGSYEWNVYNLFDGISRFAVPVFIMISGALMLDEEKSAGIRKLYTKNILRVVIAFLFWSVVYALQSDAVNAKEFFKMVLQGHFHMWYLFVIIALYMCVPIFRQITADKKIEAYFLVLSLFITFLLPLLSGLPYMSFIEEGLDKANINLVSGYSFYFIAGHFLNRVTIDKKKRYVIYLAGIVGFLTTPFLTRYFSLSEGKLYTGFYSYFSITVLLEAVSVFLLFKNVFADIKKERSCSGFISKLSTLTFGIYLSHILFVNLIADIEFLKSWGVALEVLVRASLVFILSAGLSLFISKIPVLKKYII